MPSTYSPSLKLELIQSGEQPGVWGNTTNKNLGTLLEQAIAGTTSVDVTAGNVILTSLNGLPDEARSATLYVFGTPGVTRVITIPDAFKNYTVQNATANIVQIKTSVGAAYDCPPLSHSYINCNDSDVVVGRSITTAGNALTSSSAPFNSPAFTGVPTAPTAAQGTNTTQLATTAFVNTEIAADTANLAPLASPAFTGVPTAPTAAVTTNTTQLATTAFVNAEIANDAPTKTGGGASGTWAIDISGNATTATTATTADAATIATTATNQSGGTVNATNVSYSGTLTGGTGVVNIGSGQIYKDAAGRIGINSTPLAWSADATVIELASNESFFYNWNNATFISSNLYQGTDGNYRFANSNSGSYYFQAAGQHFWGRTLYTPTPGALAVTVGVASINSNGQFSADAVLTSFLRPIADNSTSCGTASFRWTVVYAVTGTINTSDARQKTPVRSLKDSEIAAAQELASEIGAFQWLEAVEKKGSAARLHIGVTVQRVMQIMEKHSLDPFAYGLVCYDKWDDEFNPEGELVTPAGDVYSLRPDQLSLFIAKGQQVTMQNLASQLEQMKAELQALKG